MTAIPDAIVSVPVALTIAGSDSCAGAGLQADLKTFAALGVHGLNAVTCVVSEVPGRVSRILPVPPEMLADQLRLLLDTYPVAAVKTGMLYNGAIIREIGAILGDLPASLRPVLTVDPVMIATSGDPLTTSDALSAYREVLFPLAHLVTPNLDEAAALLGRSVASLPEFESAAREMALSLGCSVLLKGGHLGGEVATDLLLHEGTLHWLRAPFIPGRQTHGTGCTYSAAITAGLALGSNLPEACQLAKGYISKAIRDSHQWETPHGCLQALRQWRFPQNL